MSAGQHLKVDGEDAEGFVSSTSAGRSTRRSYPRGAAWTVLPAMSAECQRCFGEGVISCPGCRGYTVKRKGCKGCGGQGGVRCPECSRQKPPREPREGRFAWDKSTGRVVYVRMIFRAFTRDCTLARPADGLRPPRVAPLSDLLEPLERSRDER